MPSTPLASTPLRLGLGACLAILLLGGPTSVVALPDDAPTVAVAGDASIIVDEPIDDADDYQRLQQAMRQGAYEPFRDPPSPTFELLTHDHLVDVVRTDPLYEGTLQLARQWRDMGLQAYRQVDMNESANALDRALQNYRDVGQDLIAPDEIAEAQMFLALSQLEDSLDVVRPLEVFRSMIRLDPRRRLRTGYYPDFIVQYYDNARHTLVDQLRRQGPPDDDAQRVASHLDADYVIFLYALPPDDDAPDGARLSLHAFVWDADGENPSWIDDQSLTLDALEPDALRRGQSRLLSRLKASLHYRHLAPAPSDPGLTASPGTSRLALQLQMTYGSFFDTPSPLEDPFGNVGISLGGSWALTEEFEWITQVSITRSMRDFSGLLRRNFTTLRVFGGAELGQSFGPLRLAFGTGVEVASTGAVHVFTDRSCIPDPDRLCPGGAGTETFDSSGLFWGVGLRPRLGLALADSFELSTTLTGAYYLRSPDDNLALNFPLSVDVGLRYRF